MTKSIVEKDQKKESNESFKSLFEKMYSQKTLLEGSVVKAKIIAITSNFATVDVGLKSEGLIPLKEFSFSDEEIKEGQTINVYIVQIDGPQGEIVLSYEKAKKEELWTDLEKNYKNAKSVIGTITTRLKGGFSVSINGINAFLLGSQLDIRPIKDVRTLIGIEQPFLILKMDHTKGNIVVSRRALLEESHAETRGEILSKVHEGAILEGTVKNLTDYGAFIDLGGGLDGLIHVTDISWKRIQHPQEMLEVGQNVKTKVVKFNQETKRISLSIRQLTDDPWKESKNKFIQGEKYYGIVTSITDYGAFVELEEGIEGLIHVSEMSWTQKVLNPNKVLEIGQKVQIIALEIDIEKKRIALGLKQCQKNPWDDISSSFPKNSIFKSVVKTVTDFGIFVEVTNDIDGMVHMNDISWDQSQTQNLLNNYSKGQEIEVKVLEINPEKEKISLGIKQIESDPFRQTKDYAIGQIVTTTITNVAEDGIQVKINDNLFGFIRFSELAKRKNERRLDRFAENEKVDAIITSFNNDKRIVYLSIKELDIQQEDEALKKYGSTDSGASLGDILGEVIQTTKPKEDIKKDPSKNAPKSKTSTKTSAKKATKTTTEKVAKTTKKQETADKKSTTVKKKSVEKTDDSKKTTPKTT